MGLNSYFAHIFVKHVEREWGWASRPMGIYEKSN